MDDPVKGGGRNASHTIHLDSYLYVVLRWMRGAVSLFVSSAARRKNKKGRCRENAKEPAFPRGAV